VLFDLLDDLAHSASVTGATLVVNNTSLGLDGENLPGEDGHGRGQRARRSGRAGGIRSFPDLHAVIRPRPPRDEPTQVIMSRPTAEEGR
jgi:hypothetical protein